MTPMKTSSRGSGGDEERSTSGAAATDFRPRYVQIKEALLANIASGKWGPGSILPGEANLAAEFKVAQGTVRKAIDQLVAQNMVVRHQGKGTFVATHDSQRALMHFFRLVGDDGSHDLPGARHVSGSVGVATTQEAERLNLRRGARVIRVVRVRGFGRRPVLVERVVLPAAMFPELAANPRTGLPPLLYEYYQRQHGITVMEAVERLRAVGADPGDAKLLGVKAGYPLLEIERTALGFGGKVVEWRVRRCDTRHHHYLTTIS